MKLESAVFAVAGMCFGIILGWVIGSQQARIGRRRRDRGRSSRRSPPPRPAATPSARRRRWTKPRCSR